MIRFMLAGIALAGAAPSLAATLPSPAASPFGVAAVSDEGLAAAYGAGLSRTGFLARAARDQAEAFDRLTGELVPVTFDNWFADGNALILADRLR